MITPKEYANLTALIDSSQLIDTISKEYKLSKEIIVEYEDVLNWKLLSSNELLEWDIEFINKYKKKWDWSALIRNISIRWDNDPYILYCKKGCLWLEQYFKRSRYYYYNHKFDNTSDLKLEMCVWFWNFANKYTEHDSAYTCNIANAHESLSPYFPSITSIEASLDFYCNSEQFHIPVEFLYCFSNKDDF